MNGRISILTLALLGQFCLAGSSWHGEGRCDLAEGYFASDWTLDDSNLCSVHLSFEPDEHKDDFGSFRYSVAQPNGDVIATLRGKYWETSQHYTSGGRKVLLNLGNSFPLPNKPYRSVRLHSNRVEMVYNDRLRLTLHAAGGDTLPTPTPVPHTPFSLDKFKRSGNRFLTGVNLWSAQLHLSGGHSASAKEFQKLALVLNEYIDSINTPVTDVESELLRSVVAELTRMKDQILVEGEQHGNRDWNEVVERLAALQRPLGLPLSTPHFTPNMPPVPKPAPTRPEAIPTEEPRTPIPAVPIQGQPNQPPLLPTNDRVEASNN